MKKRTAATIILLICAVLFGHVYLSAQTSTAFDRDSFYAALSSGDAVKIDEQLEILKNNSFSEKTAFEGALLMRKAGLVSGPAKKLSLFKEGNKKLEAAIRNDANNAEYRFLRLMMQENSPAMLNYHDDIKSDSEFIRQSYKNLSPALQKAILNYSKTSKSLKTDDL